MLQVNDGNSISIIVVAISEGLGVITLWTADIDKAKRGMKFTICRLLGVILHLLMLSATVAFILQNLDVSCTNL